MLMIVEIYSNPMIAWLSLKETSHDSTARGDEFNELGFLNPPIYGFIATYSSLLELQPQLLKGVG